MKKEDVDDRASPGPADIAEMQRQIEILSQQVKRLIKAEGKLYQYQEELDAQLKQYKDLYDLNKRINVATHIAEICQHIVAYVIDNLEYERVILFHLQEKTKKYGVSALGGYYDVQEKSRMAELALEQDSTILSRLAAEIDHVICTEETELDEYRQQLGMHEYFVYPLGTHFPPPALLAVGNSEHNAAFYRRVNDSNATRLSLGNLVGLASSSIENHLLYARMQKALEDERLAQAKYRSIFENAIEGIFQRTAEGRYIDANPSLARMLGYASPQELISSVTNVGQQLYVQPESYEELIRRLEEQDVVEAFEAQIRRRDGSVMWAAISSRVVRDDTGAVLYYEGTVEEITERKRAEEALRESERRYRQLSEALEQRVKEAVAELRQKDDILILQGRQVVMGEMISNIAHQWRQPLNVLGLLAQELQLRKEVGELDDEVIDANVKKTMEIINQMSGTIDDLRYFFKPDKDRVVFKAIEAIDKTISLVEGSLKARQITIAVTATDDPVINGYPGQFTQVLLNILMNARDALIGRKIGNPEISLNVSEEGGKTVVTIADNAGGIPEEIIDKIFDPYFTTKGPEQGTGLGLFMCKTIIGKNMQGALTVRNVRDGAEFRIEI